MQAYRCEILSEGWLETFVHIFRNHVFLVGDLSLCAHFPYDRLTYPAL